MSMMATRRSPAENGLYPPPAPDVAEIIFAVMPTPALGLKRALVKHETAALNQRVKVIADWLKPATATQIKTLVQQAFATMGGSAVSDDEVELMLAGYATVLADLPAWSIQRALMKFSRNEVAASEIGAKHIEPGMRPNSAQLYTVAKAMTVKLSEEGLTITKALRAPDPKVLKPKDIELAKAKAAAWRAEQGVVTIEHDAPKTGYALRVAEDLKRKARQRLLDEYTAAGLEAPTDEFPSSLPLMLSLGWKIIKGPDGGKVLAKPDQWAPLNRSLGR